MRKKIGAVGAVDRFQSGGVYKIGVDRILRVAEFALMDTSAEFFGASAAVDQPLLEPGCEESRLRGGSEDATDMRRAEGRESGFNFRGFVRISRIQIRIDVEDRFGALVEQNERGVVKGLIEKVIVNPFGERAAIVDVALLRIGGPSTEGRDAGLDNLPIRRRSSNSRCRERRNDSAAERLLKPRGPAARRIGRFTGRRARRRSCRGRSKRDSF